MLLLTLQSEFKSIFISLGVTQDKSISQSEISNKLAISFENTFNSMVYHVQLSHFTFGDCYSFFYVSDYKDEWDSDRYDLSHGFALAYVWNRTDEICSEFGSISFEPKFGGVVGQG